LRKKIEVKFKSINQWNQSISPISSCIAIIAWQRCRQTMLIEALSQQVHLETTLGLVVLRDAHTMRVLSRLIAQLGGNTGGQVHCTPATVQSNICGVGVVALAVEQRSSVSATVDLKRCVQLVVKCGAWQFAFAQRKRAIIVHLSAQRVTLSLLCG
jgi:hypothetical protein